MPRWLMILLVILAMLAVIVMVVVFSFIGQYNKVIALNENVKSAWGNVDTTLQLRYDLIPNMVEVARSYAEHEREVFENIAEARTRYFQAQTPEEKIEAAPGVERALSRLLMLQEQYPQLRASEPFRDLMVTLSGTENRINVARQRYNEAVRQLNSYVNSFFGRIVAAWAGVDEAEYFEIQPAAREAPRVDMSPRNQSPQTTPTPQDEPPMPAPAPQDAPPAPGTQDEPRPAPGAE